MFWWRNVYSTIQVAVPLMCIRRIRGLNLDQSTVFSVVLRDFTESLQVNALIEPLPASHVFLGSSSISTHHLG